MNFAKVRSATSALRWRAGTAILLAGGLVLGGLAAPAGARAAPPRVTIAVLPGGTSHRAIGRVEAMSPGAISAGLGNVQAAQTYLDVGQGNRIFDSLYEERLPSLFTVGGRVPPRLWDVVTRRAAEAPADIVPGLLASTLSRHAAVRADPLAGLAALAAVDRAGRVPSTGRCPSRGCSGLTVTAATPGRLAPLAARLRGDDMLIAIERPPPEPGELLSGGIAGRGFDGVLTSDSTRIPGLVLTTDFAPTILDRYGVAVPAGMSGNPIGAEGEPDAEDVASLERRLIEVKPRRGPVIGATVVAWVALTLLAVSAFGTRGARAALVLLAVSAIYLPSLLLLTAALEPSEWGERLIVGFGAPLLAAVTLRLVPGYAAVGVAAALTVAGYAIDVVAGSPLTALSLMGPNPALGVRFFGIGNELEATLAPLVLIGTGAALAALLPASARGDDLDDRARMLAAVTFAAAALVAVGAFAPGRFGADVGAAIVLPIGAAVAAAVVLGGARRRLLLLLVAAPVLALGALAAVDLVLGGDAHLSRSVLEAGGLEEVGEVAERRLRLSAASFSNTLGSPFLFGTLALIVAAVIWRRRIASWFAGRRPALAGFLGAAAAVAAGTLANDSGVLLLMIGTGYLALFAGFAWATGPAARARGKPHA